MQPIDQQSCYPNPKELLTLGIDAYYRRYYSDSSQPKAYFGFECEICEEGFFIPRIQFVHAVDNRSAEYEHLRAAGFECLYDDGKGNPPTLLQNFVETSEQYKQLCRITDPALAEAEGW
jgi:hypothetical protein